MKKDFFDTDEFKEILNSYETSKEQGTSCYFDAEDFADIADYYLTRGCPDDGLECLDIGLDIHPNNGLLLSVYSGIHIFKHQFVEARNIINELPADANEEDVMYQKGQLAFALDKDVEAADAIFHEWVRSVEKSSRFDEGEARVRDCYIHIVTSYLELGEQRNSYVERVNAWVKEYLDRFEVLGEFEEDLMLADIVRDEFLTDLVIGVYSRLLENDPYIKNGWTILAAAQNIEGKIQDSMESCDFALAINPDDYDAMMTKAHNLYAMGELEQALPYFDKSIDQFPDGANSLVYGICLVMCGQPSKGADHLKKAVKYLQRIKETEPEYYAASCHDAAEALLMCDGEAEAGVEAIDMALSIDPDNPNFFLTKGSLLLNLVRIEQAMDAFSHVMRLSEDQIDMAVLSIGLRLVYHNQEQLALELFDKTTSTFPMSDEYVRLEPAYRALANYQLKNVEDFLENLKKACVSCPEVVATFFANVMPKGLEPSEFYTYVMNNPLSV